MRDKLLRALGPTGRTRGAANARSKIIIMHNLLLGPVAQSMVSVNQRLIP